MISLLLPPQSVKKEYKDQIPAKYVFKCKDGVIQVPEYGILRSEFYFQEWIVDKLPLTTNHFTLTAKLSKSEIFQDLGMDKK